MTHFTSFSHLNAKRVLAVLCLHAVLSIGIGYLISPKIIFQPTVYREGDIILDTIHITEDLLIPDKVSTRLKREKLLQEQWRIYDFDPNVLTNTKQKIKEAFAGSRELNSRFLRQQKGIELKNRQMGLDYFEMISGLQTVEKQMRFYESYLSVLNDRLRFFNQERSLSAKDFVRKAKTDADLNAVSQIYLDLQKKKGYYQAEIDGFQNRLDLSAEENRNQVLTIEREKREARDNFDRMLSLGMTEVEKKALDFPYDTKEMETQLVTLLSKILSREIVVSKEILPKTDDMLEIRNLSSGETTTLKTTESFLDLTEARLLVDSVAKEALLSDESSRQRNFLIMLGQKLIRPTVSENKLEFEKRRAELISNKSKVFFSVKKGEVIARAGDRASNQQVELINSYYELAANQDKLPGLIGAVLLVFAVFVLVSFIFSLPNLNLRIRFKYHFLIMSAVLITLLLVKGGVQLGELIETRYLDVQSHAYNLILPVALGSMLVGILLSFEAALITGLITALFCSLILQSNLYFFIYAMMGCIVASLPMTRFDSRYSLLLHGLKISAINLPMMLIIHLIESNQIGTFGWFNIAAALFSGVLTAIFTSILLPFFEALFDITTNLKLLELSNMNHPALKELILKAPGTYQHSIIVGNLAESGAAKIGANPLLSRVAAYYHDIGKAVDPHYYIENQAPSLPNIHDSMDPFDSADVIIQHLKKGTELSEKYRLGKDIGEILAQHHGTNLVKFFYNKALEENNQGDVSADEIEQNRFRYPGPKPQSLEAGLVMLADVSEACCRSLDSPTPELIRGIVKKVCWGILEDGQLDESGLTLETFHIVVDVYASMLISFYHQRIKYPEKILPVEMSLAPNP